MAEVKMKEFDSSVIPYFLKLEKKHYWVDYDDEVDVLYISFRKPQCANDSVMKEDFIYHYDEKEMVGVTILNASKR